MSYFGPQGRTSYMAGTYQTRSQRDWSSVILNLIGILLGVVLLVAVVLAVLIAMKHPRGPFKEYVDPNRLPAVPWVDDIVKRSEAKDSVMEDGTFMAIISSIGVLIFIGIVGPHVVAFLRTKGILPPSGDPSRPSEAATGATGGQGGKGGRQTPPSSGPDVQPELLGQQPASAAGGGGSVLPSFFGKGPPEQPLGSGKGTGRLKQDDKLTEAYASRFKKVVETLFSTMPGSMIETLEAGHTPLIDFTDGMENLLRISHKPSAETKAAIKKLMDNIDGILSKKGTLSEEELKSLVVAAEARRDKVKGLLHGLDTGVLKAVIKAGQEGRREVSRRNPTTVTDEWLLLETLRSIADGADPEDLNIHMKFVAGQVLRTLARRDKLLEKIKAALGGKI